MKRILREKFFNRPTLIVAKELLGKYLVRKVNGREICGMITEIEAYDGFHDKASHASRGKTERNKIMFGPAGHWYIYFTYGMHWILNIITREEGYPAAVLIRGVLLKEGPAPLEAGRPEAAVAVPLAGRPLTGPARVTKYFKIDNKLNGEKANKASPFGKLRAGGLWIEDRGIKIPRSKIKRSPRIGVHYAGPVWAGKLHRFYIKQKDAY